MPVPTADTTVRRNPWTWFTDLVSRHRGVVALWVMAGMLAGGLYGLLGPGTYTAESRLLVGTFEAPAAAVPGYVLASQTVAGNYARLASSSAVAEKLPTDLSLSPDQISSMVTVTAIPESAIVRVVATSNDAGKARTAAEAMADALNATVADLNARNSGDALLADYRTASQELAAATATATEAQAAVTQGQQPAAAAQNALDTANLAVDTAKLKVAGLATQYQTQQATVSTSSQMRLLGGANVTQESRTLGIVTDMAIGALLGLVIGVVLAWRTDRRVARRVAAVDDADDAFGDDVDDGGFEPVGAGG
jgi:capsular polysaccharide biosynthesis protein